jgi:hypothetical protein
VVQAGSASAAWEGGGLRDGVGRLAEVGRREEEDGPHGGVVDGGVAVRVGGHDAALALPRQQGEEVVGAVGGLVGRPREADLRPGQALAGLQLEIVDGHPSRVFLLAFAACWAAAWVDS